MTSKVVRLGISGMTCQGCAAIVACCLGRGKGIVKVAIRWRQGKGEVIFDPALTSEEKIISSQVFRGVFSAELLGGDGDSSDGR